MFHGTNQATSTDPPAELTNVTLIRREEERVWLDLDEFYPPPLQQPTTVFKAWAIASRAMDADTTYVELMGVSAAAFRLQVGANLCPSSPHPRLGYDCCALARDALGYGFETYSHEPDDEAGIRAIRDAVVAGIERGHPMLAEEEETGLVVGYTTAGHGLLARHPYSHRGDEPLALDDWPWSFSAITKLPGRPGLDVLVGSLAVAVELARAEEPFGNDYSCGFAAYERWITNLLDPSFVEDAEVEPHAVVLGNAHILYCLVDARRRASEYLSVIRPLFPEDASASLLQAAYLYDEVARQLDTLWESVPWPQQMTSATDWTMKLRGRQANVLEEVVGLERGAVVELEAAVAQMG